MDKIYDILVKEAGASETWRYNFVNDKTWNEFRFGGDLGFGGKYWRKNPERLAIIERTNEAIKELCPKQP